MKRLLFLMQFCISSLAFANPERLLKSGINSSFDFDTNKSFPEYIEYSRDIIARGRVDITDENRESIIDKNSPFALLPDKKCKVGENGKYEQGIILMHGIKASPYHVRGIAERFNDRCFVVYAMLMTGHGTRPGDLLDVSFKEWSRQLEYGIKELKQVSNKIYIGGHSTGGQLSLLYAMEHPNDEEIDGLVLASPAIRLPFRAIFTPLTRLFRKWILVSKDDDIVQYSSFATNSAAQVQLMSYRFNHLVRRNKNALKMHKIISVFSHEDATIDSKKSMMTLIRYANQEKLRVILYHQKDVDSDISSLVKLIRSPIKDENILGTSHMSAMLDINDSYYKINGSYRDCLHYENKNKEKYNSCKNSDNVYFGEIVKENLEMNLPLVRIGFNPFLDEFFNSTVDFMEIDSE